MVYRYTYQLHPQTFSVVAYESNLHHTAIYYRLIIMCAICRVK
jgi:hypothetical protein